MINVKNQKSKIKNTNQKSKTVLIHGFLTFYLIMFSQFNTLSSQSSNLNISFSKEIINQGDILLIKVESGKEIYKIFGEFLNKKLYFYQNTIYDDISHVHTERQNKADQGATRQGSNEGMRSYDALYNSKNYSSIVGIDLEQSPKTYKFLIKVNFHDGSKEENVKKVNVVEKKFGEQRLTLPKEKVELGDEDLKRVKEEEMKLNKIWGKEDAEKLWSGNFIQPVEGTSSGTFGLRRIINEMPRSPHTGIDIVAPNGTEVHASNYGRVALSDDLFFSGLSIIIDHGQGMYTMYFHLSKSDVREGDIVEKGQVIGQVGASGRATAPHLHWGIRLQGARVDPISVLNISMP